MITQATLTKPVTLTATNDFGATRQCNLELDQGVFVGRSSNCGLQLPDNGIADIECRIGFEENKLMVQNWLSSKGTQVNGQVLVDDVEIRVGDVIQIGEHRIVVSDKGAMPEPDQSASAEPVAAIVAEARGSDVSVSKMIVDDIEIAIEEEVQDIPVVAESPMDQPSHDLQQGGQVSDEMVDSESMDLDVDFFDIEEEEMYDRETVALLQAEIEDLQSALAERDAVQPSEPLDHSHQNVGNDDQSDEVLLRMQDLIDEANRSDERVAMLEEMLQASEETNRSEHEERHQLEAWVGDIEKRIGQREDEHAAEMEALRGRLEESTVQQEKLQRKIQQAAFSGSAPKQYEETLESIQQANKELQEKLAESQKRCISLETRVEEMSGEQERVLRDERAAIAKEQAKVSRLRFELSSKMSEIEEMPKSENTADKETAHRIQTLRQHLREIHEQEKAEEKDASLGTRLSKLWKRVEY